MHRKGRNTQCDGGLAMPEAAVEGILRLRHSKREITKPTSLGGCRQSCTGPNGGLMV
jgi:hypothetical protein